MSQVASGTSMLPFPFSKKAYELFNPDFKRRNTTRDEEGPFIMGETKKSVCVCMCSIRSYNILNMHVFHNRASKYRKQKTAASKEKLITNVHYRNTLTSLSVTDRGESLVDKDCGRLSQYH